MLRKLPGRRRPKVALHIPCSTPLNRTKIKRLMRAGKGMKAAFWRFAHRRYQGRKPMLLTDIAAFVWFTLFALVYGGALAKGWLPSTITEAVVGIVLIGAPFTVGVLHRRSRIEAAKAPDALYRKRVETSRIPISRPRSTISVTSFRQSASPTPVIHSDGGPKSE